MQLQPACSLAAHLCKVKVSMQQVSQAAHQLHRPCHSQLHLLSLCKDVQLCRNLVCQDESYPQGCQHGD